MHTGAVVILSVIFFVYPPLFLFYLTVFLILFHIIWFTGPLDEYIYVEVTLADTPVVFTRIKQYLSKTLWQVRSMIHDSVSPFVLMVHWQGIHPLDFCPVY